MTIIDKMKIFMKLREDLNTFIMDKANDYMYENRIMFSDPQGWIIEDDFTQIEIFGKDGCMGCYDPMYIYIPMEYFGLDPKDFEE